MNPISLIGQFKNHTNLLDFFKKSKEAILQELQTLVKENQFKKLNIKYFSGLLNTNNSIYLFMGFLVKYIRHKYLDPKLNCKNIIHESMKMIQNIKINFFNAISKKKQMFKKKICLSKERANYRNNKMEENLLNSKSVKTQKFPKLDYVPIFLKIILANPNIKTIIEEIMKKFFANDEELMKLITDTIKSANEKKMGDIVNLSKSLAIIQTNTHEKIFAILDCLLQSNDLLRPVSFTEIQDAFVNVKEVLQI